MAKAKKLPSGSWRCLVYSHTETIIQPDGTKKEKRIYKSFTNSDTSTQGKRKCEADAAEWAANKERLKKEKKRAYGDITLYQAIDMYIASRELLGRSPTTVQDYRCIQKNGFQDLMQMHLKDIDEEIIQEAVNNESRRSVKRTGKTLSVKRLRNEYGLLTAVLGKYCKGLYLNDIELPNAQKRTVELPPVSKVFEIVKGTDIELPVLLAAWLSFSMSEIRGLTKSKSIHGDYITIEEVMVDVNGVAVTKEDAKTPTRKRRHRIPAYIKRLIDKVDGDVLVPMSGKALYHRWIRLQDENGMQHITFHDLRHINASVMAALRIPDKYAQERGGWASDRVMKDVYMQTFSEDRERYDDIIDNYFEDIMQHEMQHE